MMEGNETKELRCEMENKNKTFLMRNIHWLYFMAGIVIAGGRLSPVDNYVAGFGEYSTVGYITVGFVFILVVKLFVKLSELLFREKVKK